MSKKARRKTDRINVRIRSEDTEIGEYIDQLHSSVSLSDMARQSILYCIRHQVFNFPDKSGHIPQKPERSPQPEPATKAPRAIKSSDQLIDESTQEEASDFSSLFDSLDI